MKLTVHTIVRNEDQWLWFALQAVLPFAEKIIIFDTGSTDQTINLIKSIYSPKIIFEEKGIVTPKDLSKLRQEQVERTSTDWFLIVDGDEIWPQRQLEKLIKTVQNDQGKVLGYYNYTRNCIGDVFHYLPEEAGKYTIAKKTGNLNFRLIKKTADLKLTGEYPLESYINHQGPLLKQTESLRFVDCWYLHTTYLKRSNLDQNKVSGSFGKAKIWEKGLVMKESELPEVLFQTRPAFVDDPLRRRSFFYESVAFLTTPLLKIKRAYL